MSLTDQLKAQILTPAQTSEARPRVTYLHPGQTFVHAGSAPVATIVGSCVAVFLWDPVCEAGGLTHFLLPEWDRIGAATSRYGNVALEELLEKLLALGCKKTRLRAKVFGGACVLRAFQGNGGKHLGTKNSEFAIDWLDQRYIPVVEQQIGGTRGRKIEIDTGSGAASVREV